MTTTAEAHNAQLTGSTHVEPRVPTRLIEEQRNDALQAMRATVRQILVNGERNKQTADDVAATIVRDIIAPLLATH